VRSQEADLDRALEVLRRELYSIVGPEYDRHRVQEARIVSRRMDELIVRIMRDGGERQA